MTLASPALAFPDRMLRVISGFPPGGPNDVVNRAIAQVLTPILGQTVVVENRAWAVRRPHGPRRMGTRCGWTQAILPTAMRTLPYDPERDFASISFVANLAFAYITGPLQPSARDFPGLIAAARASSGAITFASWGVASTSHLAMERVIRQQGVEMSHVPFTGLVDCMALPAGGAEGAFRGGLVRVVAVASKQRVPPFPDAPTILELGGTLDAGLWKAIYAPARTLAPVIARLNTAVRQPSFIELLRLQGAVPERSMPEQLAALLSSERQAWGDVVRATGAFRK